MRDGRAVLKYLLDMNGTFSDQLQLWYDKYVKQFRLVYPLGSADKTHILYLGIIGILLCLFRSNLPVWDILFTLHVAGTITILFIVRSATSHPESKLLSFIRTWYHLPVFLLLFEEVNYTVHMIHTGWSDDVLLRLEYGIFNVHPTIWLEQFAWKPLTEYMSFGYFSYFLLIPVSGTILLVRGNRDIFNNLIYACATGYYVCYLIFPLFPIEGPYHTLGHLQQVDLDGWGFTFIVERLQGFGRVHGAAFPSAHVAAATVVLIFMWVYERKTTLVFGPVIFSLYVSTVYLRYHYASDVPAGIVVGILAAVSVLRFKSRPAAISNCNKVKPFLLFILISALLIMNPAPAQATTLNELRTPEVKEVLSLTLDFQFEEASTRVNKMIGNSPDDPVPMLLKTEILWWMHINRRDSQEIRTDLLDASRECIRLAEIRLKHNPQDHLGYFAGGNAHARVAAVLGIEGKKWAAVKEAMKARKIMNRLKRIAPDTCDVYGPLGIYEYYAAKQGIAARLAGGIMYGLFGDAERGISYLKKVVECGEYSVAESGFFLSLFYVHWENKPGEAIKILEELSARYPGNLPIKGIHAYALGKEEKYEQAVLLYRNILKTAIERDMFGPEGYGTTRFFLAQLLEKQQRYNEAADELDEVIRLDIQHAEWLVAHTHLARARIHIMNNEHDRAKHELILVLEMGDHSESHRQANELIRNLRTSHAGHTN